MAKGPFLLEVVWPNGRRQALSFHKTAKRAAVAEKLRAQGATVKLHDQLQAWPQ